LSFRHYFRRFAEDHVVEVSNDSLSWVSFYSSASLIARNTTINNSTLTRLNISSVAANQPQIWIRFRYVGAWDWFWALDDIEIANLPPNDLILEDWDISPKVGLCFNAQMARVHLQDSLIFSGAVYNYGENTQPNVRLNARAFQGASPLYNNNSPAVVGMSSNSRDTLEARPYLAMVNLPVGNYTLRIEALSDSTDGSPSNNVDTTLLMITEDRISPFYPASTSLGTLGTSSFTGEEDGVIVTSLVNLSVQDTVTGIRVYLRSNTVPGGLIAVSMRDTDGIEGSPAIEFPVLVESDSITVTAADVARGYMDIPIPAILAGVLQERILPAGPYYAAAQLFSNSASSHIRIPDDLSNEAFMPWYASMVYLPTDGSWYSNGIAMGIAALFAQNSQPCTTSITNILNISGCGFAVLSSGDTVNQSGTYIDTLPNSMGCDSILNQIVTIQNPSICNPIPSYVPTNGLVGWWGFNGNALDGSGNGNHGTVNGATLITDRFGNQNGAYSFDGVNSSINVINSSTLQTPNSITINLWMSFSGIQQSNSRLISKGWSPMGFELHRDLTFNNKIRFGGAYNGNGYGPLSQTIFNDSVWYMITALDNGSVKYLFVNGVLEDSLVHNYGVIPTSQASLFFGRNSQIATDFLNGKLDDIGIWNRAITPQEITNLYNSQLPTQTSLCLPSITTNVPTSIGIDSVIVGGNITNDGGSSIVLRGVCYSTTPNPNMGNMRTEDGSGVGSFSTILRNLNPSTTYYVRSYAKNTNGVVVYGDEVTFTTLPLLGQPCPGTPTVTDIDGNVYNTVKIGNQCWTQSNLKVSRFRNGDSILTGFSNNDWYNLFYTPAYSIYNNDAQNNLIFGKLYNHVSVRDSREICPTGWHVPTDTEWNVLVKFLDSDADTSCNNCVQSPIAGGALKSTSIFPIQSGWMSPNTGATNSSGFFGTPGGMRDGHTGTFNDLGNVAFWWTSSSSHAGHPARVVLHNGANVNKGGNFHGLYGFSVRCLKD
jgi:uncharacterized protein (TIGR02145 family)